jgi:hypothetical protein
MPQDFRGRNAGQPYRLQGSVHTAYEAGALLGFNLAEPPGSANCAYDAQRAHIEGTSEVLLGGSGLALAYQKNASFPLRVVLRGQQGAADPSYLWCADLSETSGPVFISYASFNTACWDGSGNSFNPAADGVSSISFVVPGTLEAYTAFEYCVFGLAEGSSASDAPTQGSCQ